MKSFLKVAALLGMLAASNPATAQAYRAKTMDVRFFVDHPFKRVEGICSQITSDLSFKGTPERAELSAPGTITVALAGVDTGNSNRTSHALEVLGFPSHKEVVAKIASITNTGPGAYTISGTLTIRGATRPFSTSATAAAETTGVRVTGSFSIKMTDYGLENPSLLTVKAKDDVLISFSLLLEPAA